jgi:hypothetical protein
MFDYKNKTQSKIIPQAFIGSVHVFFARYMMKFDGSGVWDLTDTVQQDILNNLFEKEGDGIGHIKATDPHRRHVIITYSQLLNNESGRLSETSFLKVTKGLVELISGRKKFTGKADVEIDMREIAVEFHEEDSTFDRQTFQTLFSIRTVAQDCHPEVENPLIYFLQALEAIGDRT